MRMLLLAMLLTMSMLAADEVKKADPKDLPDSINKIVKWEEARMHTTSKYAPLTDDKATRQAILNLPKDGALYHVELYKHGYLIFRIMEDGSEQTIYRYHANCGKCGQPAGWNYVDL